jgi:hypothetical protein
MQRPADDDAGADAAIVRIDGIIGGTLALMGHYAGVTA